MLQLGIDLIVAGIAALFAVNDINPLLFITMMLVDTLLLVYALHEMSALDRFLVPTKVLRGEVDAKLRQLRNRVYGGYIFTVLLFIVITIYNPLIAQYALLSQLFIYNMELLLSARKSINLENKYCQSPFDNV